MDARLFRLRLQPLSDFGTPLVGDTLFGHLCWALRWRHGSESLAGCLRGYGSGSPFAVVSDAFPAGWLPRPSVSLARLGLAFDPALRKADKRRVWLPLAEADRPLGEWVQSAGSPEGGLGRAAMVTQNTIDRMTGTTGTGMFAPRQVERMAFAAGQELDVYLVVNAASIEPAQVFQAFEDIGQTGYGRDASTGLGKFKVLDHQVFSWPAPPGVQHGITLAPCVPEPSALLANDCHYLPATRFGRHGSSLALAGQPFKKPLLMLRTGALLAFAGGNVPVVHGRGLGGVKQPISDVEPATVHQGYSPVVPVQMTAPVREEASA